MTGSSVTQGRLITSSIAAILMLSSVVVIGYLGQLSLANLTFAGVAAYLSCRFAAVSYTPLTLPTILRVLMSVVAV